jgi:enoyl-CoA hydratase
MIDVEMDGSICHVSLRGSDSRNLITWDFVKELKHAAIEIGSNRTVRAVILSSRSNNFTMGFDINYATKCFDGALDDLRALNELGGEMCDAWAAIPATTICVIDGFCVGGGVALAVACDFRIASSRSTFMVPEVFRGMNMGWGAIPRLVNLVGPARTKQICLLGQNVEASKAIAWGLADELEDTCEITNVATEYARKAASLPPVAAKMIKRSVDRYVNALAGLATQAESDQFLLMTKSEDFAEGLNSFQQKRNGIFSGR